MAGLLLAILVLLMVGTGVIVHRLKLRMQGQQRARQQWLATLSPEERRHQEMMRTVQQSTREAAFMQMSADLERDDWNRRHGG